MVLDPSSQSAGYPSAPAVRKRAVSREDRTEELRRARAAARVLRIAYPQLEQLRIDLSFVDPSSNRPAPASQVHMLHPPARSFFTYRCPYWDCDGEFELADIVRMAVACGSYEAHGSLFCTGVRPGEKCVKRACQLQLTYAVTARVGDGG
jgi:hypothetical protein